MNAKTTQGPHSRFKLPEKRHVLVCGVVLCVATLSFFVHTVAEGVDRGAQFRAGMSMATAR